MKSGRIGRARRVSADDPSRRRPLQKLANPGNNWPTRLFPEHVSSKPRSGEEV
jgi:hypothetical protein